ncbi:DUF2513 domain-containing protein [Salmonella enterica subsp. enterica serovar Uganda]|nr:DUF2513 domain-containing protein [Salmonella enterica subsp. enterica serovar Uganda]EDZ8927990.1 DUF2513 domain-containing protein [Salmonella enterica]
MVRDMDIVRKIVLTLQGRMHEPYESIPLDNLFDVKQNVYGFNAKFLLDTGLAEGEDTKLTGLTWAGHEFADSIQNEEVWNKVKASVIDSGIGWTFPLLQEFIAAEIKKKVSEST